MRDGSSTGAGLVAALTTILVAVALPITAAAATITVDSPQDDNAADPTDCELREAITAANDDVAVDTCVAGLGADTIVFSFTSPAVITLNGSPLPPVTDPVTLDAFDGPGCTGDRQVTLDGTLSGGNGFELAALSDGSTVCGFRIGEFALSGISVASDGNSIRGNRLGLGAGANSFGVALGSGAQGNVIGGSEPGDENVISGNDILGILIEQASGNRIEGNLVGTGPAGTVAVPNGQQGIRITDDGSSNVIGGEDEGEGNLISGNGSTGVQVQGGDNNEILGNFIGTNQAGTAVVANGGGGVELATFAAEGATGNQVGAPDTTLDATTPGPRNVISGNAFSGVRIAGAGSQGNTVAGNFIGTDVTGTADLGNGSAGFSGVEVESAAGANTIGGISSGAENVISGNEESGITTAFDLAGTTTIQGNLIGTDRTGTAVIGNGEEGIQIDGSDVVAGGTAAGAGNTIANNTGDGILVIGSGDGNQLLGNSIFSNGDLGIDLFGGGVTDNDVNDIDSGGPNDGQNYPLLTAAAANSVDTSIEGTLESDAAPPAQYRFEFFSSPACDASGNGEGQVPLGAAEVPADANGDAEFDAAVDPAPAGEVITATATNLATGDTSEFSDCLPLVAKAEPPAPPAPPTPPAPTPDTEIRFDASAGSKQKVKKLEADLTCSEAGCSVSIEGQATVPKGGSKGKKEQAYELRDQSLSMGDGETTTAKLEFRSHEKTTKKLREQLKDDKVRKKAKAKVNVTASDAAGNSKTIDLTIKLKR